MADARGERVGHVESLLYGTAPDHADAVAVCSGGVFRRHFIVPAALGPQPEGTPGGSGHEVVGAFVIERDERVALAEKL